MAVGCLFYVLWILHALNHLSQNTYVFCPLDILMFQEDGRPIIFDLLAWRVELEQKGWKKEVAYAYSIF